MSTRHKMKITSVGVMALVLGSLASPSAFGASGMAGSQAMGQAQSAAKEGETAGAAHWSDAGALKSSAVHSDAMRAGSGGTASGLTSPDKASSASAPPAVPSPPQDSTTGNNTGAARSFPDYFTRREGQGILEAAGKSLLSLSLPIVSGLLGAHFVVDACPVFAPLAALVGAIVGAIGGCCQAVVGFFGGGVPRDFWIHPLE